jgi:hypothetical protein
MLLGLWSHMVMFNKRTSAERGRERILSIPGGRSLQREAEEERPLKSREPERAEPAPKPPNVQNHRLTCCTKRLAYSCEARISMIELIRARLWTRP